LAKRATHFQRHRKEFPGVVSDAEYEERAITFLNRPLTPEILEGVRRHDAVIIRLNRVTQEFGVMYPTGIIKSYFKAHPAVHGKRTNIHYFQFECAK
jgi:hypothetical protein